ncbi:Rib/alpha-like domain-containing protein, partial [Corynebacterium pseudodiphtheriticum]|uniref:Rib/alpha-like domain-containing protein n=1 Tax=Corynebacterium pseudodiphtheriticum TaxID=37637 RepID=UPI0025513479
MNHQIPMNKAVRRKGVTIAAAALSVALVAPFAQSVAYPEISAAAQAQENARQELTLKRNPPVFYADNAKRGTEGAARSGSGRHVRSTGVLADTYFPAGTKFELADPSWTFNKGGWFGWNKNNDGSIVSAGSGAPSEMQNPSTGKAYPFVVEDTGQVLFGLGAAANFGDRMMIPMRARYSAQDPETGQTREYVWRFEQGIQVGDKNAPADASNATCAPGEHWVNPPANLNQNILGHTMTKATQIEVQGQGTEVTPPTLSGPILSGESSISGNADGTGALQSRRATITVNVPGLEPLTTRAGIAGKWSISLPSGETFKDGQEISVTRTTHDGKKSLPVKLTVGDGQNKDRVAPPTINPVVAEAQTISGLRTRYAPVFVKFPGKAPIWAAPKEDHEYRDGEWSINVPGDVSLKAGDKIEVTAGYGGITLGTRNRNSNNSANLGTGASNYGFLNEVSGLTGGCYKDGETPKENPAQVDLKLTPEGDIDGQVGQPINPVGVAVTNQPEKTKVKVDGLPDGLTYNPETKQIEGTPTAKTPEGGTEATITLVDEQGNAVKNAAGQDVSSKIRVTISPEEIQPPVVSDTLGYPDDTIQISADDEGAARKSAPVSPNLPDSIEKEDGDKYRFGNDLPEGFAKDPNNPNRIVKDGPVGESTPDDSSDDVVVTINPDTGEITVEAGDKGDTNGPKDIPVEYVGADDTVKGKDSVSVDVKPRPDSDSDEQTPLQGLNYPEGRVAVGPEDSGDQRTKKTGEPVLPESIKEDEGKFRFGDDLPEGFAKDPNNPNRIVKDGPVGESTPDDSSDDVVVTINPGTGEITVEAGDKGDTNGPKDIPVEYVGADDTVKGKDSVSVDVKPRPDSDSDEQSPANGLKYPEDEIAIGANDSGDQRTKESGEPEISASVTKENDDIFRFHKELPPGFERVNDEETRVKFDGGTPNDEKDDVQLTIDPKTGKVTVVGGENAKAKADIPVELINKDGEPKDSGVISINVTPEAQQTPPPATDDDDTEITGLGYPGNIFVAPDNYERRDSTGIPKLPESLKEEGGSFRFGPNLPDGFVKQEPSWPGVEEIVREGDSPSERIVLRINKSNGKVEVQAGDASDYPLSDLPIEYLGANGEVKKGDKVTVLVRPTLQSHRFDPKGKTIIVAQGGNPDAAEGVANKGELPEGTEFEFDGPVDTSTPGEKSAKVIVAYPDGSTESVDVTVNVAAADEDLLPDADRFDPKWESVNTPEDGSAVTVPNSG